MAGNESNTSQGSQDYVGVHRNEAVLASVNGVLSPRAEAKVSEFDSGFVLADPRGLVGALCAGCGISFDDAMLSCPPGRRAHGGVWAPA